MILEGAEPVGFALVTRPRIPGGGRAGRGLSHVGVFRPQGSTAAWAWAANAATLIFDRFAGDWEIVEYLRHPASVAFWRRVPDHVCQGNSPSGPAMVKCISAFQQAVGAALNSSSGQRPATRSRFQALVGARQTENRPERATYRGATGPSDRSGSSLSPPGRSTRETAASCKGWPLPLTHECECDEYPLQTSPNIAFEFVRSLAGELTARQGGSAVLSRKSPSGCSRILSDPKSTGDQVVRVVGSEPALAARLTANCEFGVAQPQRTSGGGPAYRDQSNRLQHGAQCGNLLRHGADPQRQQAEGTGAIT